MTQSPLERELAALAASGPPIALVTGAARRVGREIALELARAGCDIVIHHHASEAEARGVRAEIHSLGRRGVCWRLDLSDLSGVERAAADLAGRLPRLDVLVHNASIYAPTPLTSLNAETLSRFHAVNAGSPALLSAAFSAHLSRSTLDGGGAIVAMLDIHAMGLPRREFAPYAMSKASLHELVRSLARDLAPRVRVNGVAPGVVAWPDEGYESDRAAQEAYLARVPLARPGRPGDAAEAVRWLALEARYVTGQVIRVDGGRSLM